MAKRLLSWCRRHWLISPILAALVLTLPVLAVMGWGRSLLDLSVSDALILLVDVAFVYPLFAAFFVYPLVLTGIECCLLLRRPDGARRTVERVYDGITLALGAVYTPTYLVMICNTVWADWPETLSNSSVHTPLASWHLPTILLFLAIGLVGYLVLNYLPLRKLPPLVVVLSFSGMYLACGVGIAFAVQTVTDPAHLWLVLLPLNMLFITARTVRAKMAEFQGLEREERTYRSPLLRRMDSVLCKSQWWPVLAFLLMWPFLGLLICLLTLFGQSPSAAIRAFAETSDWNLSKEVSPQNIYYDEHYLCTVAAGGHRRIVHPIRRGVRHGHPVIVNRQLCVANAFEQILEEKTPRFHRALRRFYDNYGFPIAKLIHSPFTADVIYFLMKPLEWLFLLVLYCTDVHPESRIAIQYTGKGLGDFQE